MAPSICPWPFLSPPETAAPEVTWKSFVQALAVEGDSQAIPLPPRVIIGDSVRIRITQAVYEAEIQDCSTHLLPRITLLKSDAPITTQVLKQKLETVLMNMGNWNVTPLGRGCFEFNFNSAADMRNVLMVPSISS